MKHITRELLRKRAEHNEGMISTLEEISLHQEELLDINEVLGATCRKLKILYLQNNCIAKMENLSHLKELVYLNMALNNVEKVEGLQNCECLAKLDLTVNFVDVDDLKSSMEHLASSCDRLTELYMMGNPCQANWPGFESYAIAKLPQLKTLDGKEITRSMQITARQKLPALEAELQVLAAQMRAEKEDKRRQKQLEQQQQQPTAKAASAAVEVADSKTTADASSDVVECVDVEDNEDEYEISDRDKMTENTPETRYEVLHVANWMCACEAFIYGFHCRSIKNWRNKRKKRRTETRPCVLENETTLRSRPQVYPLIEPKNLKCKRGKHPLYEISTPSWINVLCFRCCVI
jgi:hypothetical protein